MKVFFSYISFIILITLTSCNNGGDGMYTAQSIAMGKRNVITVIADKNMWESSIQDTFVSYFGSSYPIMPQPEPIFDIRHFTVKDLTVEPLRKNLRTYIVLCDLLDKEAPTTKMLIKDLGEEKYQEALKDGSKSVSAGTDKWAKNQLIVYLYGKGDDGLANSIRGNFPKVAKRINQHDLYQLAKNTFALKTHQVFTKNILERYSINMKLPSDYKEAKYDEEKNITWYRKDTKTAIMNMSIQREKYTSEVQFSKDYIIKKRDAFGKNYVSTNEENSYMVSNTVDLPVYEYDHEYGGMQTKEIRGIWEIVNDFVGGPYISFALYNKAKGDIIYIDCFIMNKGKDKRDLMQEMEYIVQSMQGVLKSS